MFGNSAGFGSVGDNSSGGSGANRDANNRPSWFQETARRTIPNTVLRREVKSSSNSGEDDNGNRGDSTNTGFNTLTFGAKKHMLLGSSNVSTGGNDHMNPLLMDNSEAPPTVSISDWKREEGLFDLRNTRNENTINTIGTPTFISPISRKKSEVSLFDSNSQSRSSSASSIGSESETGNAVVVFGYREAITKQILAYFAQFGEILEDLESELGDTETMRTPGYFFQQAPNRRRISREHGRTWTKLTYANHSSYLRALREHGTIYCGAAIGCVPYKHELISELSRDTYNSMNDVKQTNSISTNQLTQHNQSEVPKSNQTFETKPTNETERNQIKTPSAFGSDNKGNGSISSGRTKRRLSIKDGSSLFLSGTDNIFSTLDGQPTKKRMINRDRSLIGKISGWLFGWNDL